MVSSSNTSDMLSRRKTTALWSESSSLSVSSVVGGGCVTGLVAMAVSFYRWQERHLNTLVNSIKLRATHYYNTLIDYIPDHCSANGLGMRQATHRENGEAGEVITGACDCFFTIICCTTISGVGSKTSCT